MSTEKTQNHLKKRKTAASCDKNPCALAELALLVSSSGQTRSPCPSPEDLAALSEGKLSDSQRATLLEHLDCCDDCREAWLLANEALEAQSPNASSSGQPRQRFRWRRAFAYAAPLALAAGILLTVLLPGKHPYDEARLALDHAYSLVDNAKATTRGAGETAWDQALRRSTNPPSWTPTQRSYAAGLLQGRGRQKEDASRTRSAPPGLEPLLAMDGKQAPDAFAFLLGGWRRLIADVCLLSRPLSDADKNALVACSEQLRAASQAWAQSADTAQRVPSADAQAAQEALDQGVALLTGAPGLDCGALRDALDELDSTLAPLP
jgi:hypothetical protein